MRVRQRTRFAEPLEPHLRLVWHLARRTISGARPYLEIGDLVAIGTEALLWAARRYDRKRGVPFGTFAYLRVRGAMCEGIGVVGPATRGVARKRPAAKRIRTPVRYILADHLEPRVARRDICDGVATAMDVARFGPRLHEALDTLDARDRQVITRHYFADDTLHAIGRDMGRSRSWASRMHAGALARLRAVLLPAISPLICRPGLDFATAAYRGS